MQASAIISGSRGLSPPMARAPSPWVTRSPLYRAKRMEKLVMGTPGGVGVGRDPQVFLKRGDVVEVEVEGIGLLRNPVG